VAILVYAGELDTVTPVEQAIHLKDAPAKVDLRIVPKAGHFSFMNTPPPGTTDDDAFDRDRFLTDLAQTTMEFATTP
jgi:pimeloyl-ACP methyl ester carboxylesterase